MSDERIASQMLLRKMGRYVPMREMLSNVNAPVMESVNENQITIPSGTTVKIAIHTRYGAASALFFIGGFLPALQGFLLRLRIVFRVGQLVIFL